MSDEDFQVRSRSVIHLSRAESSQSGDGVQIDGILLFLYEVRPLLAQIIVMVDLKANKSAQQLDHVFSGAMEGP